MFFNDHCAQCDRRYRGADPHRMVRKSDRAAKQLAQVGNGPHIGVFGRRGVGAGAFQQGQITAAAAAGGFYCLGDFDDGGHTSRNNDRFSGLGDASDEREVDTFKRRDFVNRRIQAFEKIDCAGVKGRAKADHAAGPRTLHDGGVPFPGGMRCRVECVQRLATPERARVLDRKFSARQVERHGVGGVGLQLECVRPRVGGGVDNRQRAIERLVMVARHLRDDEGLAVAAPVALRHRVNALPDRPAGR